MNPLAMAALQSMDYSQLMREARRGNQIRYGEPAPVVKGKIKLSRNAPCQCESGRKYKRCCGR